MQIETFLSVSLILSRLIYSPCFSLQMLNRVNLLVVFVALIEAILGECPCPDSDLCKPVQVSGRHEKIAFMVSNSNWRAYDYGQLTTIVICTENFDPQLLCLAHSRKVRLVWIASYDVNQLGNASARTEWVKNQVLRVKNTYTDGVNLDLEDVIADGSEAALQYTQLVQDLSNVIHSEIPGTMVRSAELIDSRKDGSFRLVLM